MMISSEPEDWALPDRYSSIGDDWSVSDDKCFVSPAIKDKGEQIVLFNDVINNGAIFADITLLESGEDMGWRSYEASLIFRYSDNKKYYYVGTGLYGAKFGIAKASPSSGYINLSNAGNNNSLTLEKTYHLYVEFNGSKIRLFENDVQQAVAIDEDYKLGQWGLKTWYCKARFENIKLRRAKPVAFIVMPFTSELGFVHETIGNCLREFDIRPVRGDQMFRARPVIDDLKEQIANADLVLVDFTGKNPNVYYEAGLADAWKKDWIVLAQSLEDLAFDVRHIRTIHYSNTMGADIRLRRDLVQALESLGYKKKL